MSDKQFKFEPWYEHRNAEPAKLPIEEPPCKHCRHWKPHIRFNRRGGYDGVQLCVSEYMHHDFSCFMHKEESK